MQVPGKLPLGWETVLWGGTFERASVFSLSGVRSWAGVPSRALLFPSDTSMPIFVFAFLSNFFLKSWVRSLGTSYRYSVPTVLVSRKQAAMQCYVHS